MFERSYACSSGINVFAVFKDKIFGYVQSVSYYIGRNTVSKKKTIAGSILFASIDIDKILSDPPNGQWYQDQIPPFDIILEASNEYGKLARMEIKDIEIMNSGYSTSFDKIATEKPYTYIASGIRPWHVVKSPYKEDIPDIEDHTGMIYNEYTKRWSWL